MTSLLGPAEVRRLAGELDVRPTKKLGQNFVHDPNTVRRIVTTAELSPDDVVLEVGPGLGSLTLALLPACREVIAVEIDPVLAAKLPETAAERAPEGSLTVVQADALRVTQEQIGEPTALVANLPYNVAVPVVLHLLAILPSLRTGLVMVQAEVADRMAAGPGSKAYGVPSVKMAWYAEAKRAATVSRSVFWPVPNVDSALVRFVRRLRLPTWTGSGCSSWWTRPSRSGVRRYGPRWGRGLDHRRRPPRFSPPPGSILACVANNSPSPTFLAFWKQATTICERPGQLLWSVGVMCCPRLALRASRRFECKCIHPERPRDLALRRRSNHPRGQVLPPGAMEET